MHARARAACPPLPRALFSKPRSRESSAPSPREAAPRRARDAPLLLTTGLLFFPSPPLPPFPPRHRYMDGGSLADVLHAAQLTGSGPLSEMVLGKLAARTLAGLNYLHRERHQVHRDMKPGNILLNSRGEVKISDFGLSAELDSTKEMCATFIGTHAYMSPERLGGKPYSFASDIWSLGITLVECALGQFPYTAYTGSNYFVLLSQILNDPPPQLPADTFSAEFRDFILQCLCKEPEQRPSAEQLLQHPFIRMYDDALRPFDMAGFVRSVTEMRLSSGAAPMSSA